MDDSVGIVSLVQGASTTKAVIFSSFVGGVISLRFIDRMNKKQRCVAILSGMGMAHYLSPVIAYYFKAVDFEETIGFLIGLFGMSICAALFRAIENSDLWAFIQKRSGGNDV